jgi:L-alanine-DL-glutamate epimerase-like enolase superfamily enzyme
MKIQEIRLLPLLRERGGQGWESEAQNLHTLVELITDEGVTGLGSVYTSAQLVAGAVEVLRSRLIGAWASAGTPTASPATPAAWP